jgi:hypothetical protein
MGGNSLQSPFLSFVSKYLVVDGVKCSHCGKRANFVTIYQKDSSLVGAYVCSEGYVSRVVYFADNPDAVWFGNFLRDQLGDRFRGKDIRMASRYGWDLGGRAEKETAVVSKSGKIVQYYWTFYALNEEEKFTGTFLCREENGGCGKLYTKLKTEASTLCTDCRRNN